MTTRLMALGRFELTVAGHTVPPLRTNKARALTAFLLLNHDRDVSREKLLEVFWPDATTDRAREGLRTALSTVRGALRQCGVDPDDVVKVDKNIVRWCHVVEVDVERFERAARSADAGERQSAVALYQGDFLEGGFDEWVVSQRERLAARFEELLLDRVAHARDRDAAHALLERDPYAEEAYAVLIEAELDARRTVAAKTLYDRAISALSEAGSDGAASIAARFRDLAASRAVDDRLRVPFIARTVEIARLAAAFRERVGRDGYVALILGEPGIGKTALLGHVRGLAADDGRQCMSIRGTSDEALPLAVWRVLYRHLTQREIEDVAASVPEPALAIATQILASVTQPSIFLVDDAHLIAEDSKAVLRHIMQAASAHGHALVATMRTDAARTADILKGADIDERMVLGPLERTDLETALSWRLSGDCVGLVKLLHERSAGHPMFFAALLQALVDSGAIERDGDRWRVTRLPDDHLALPRDLRASIEARFLAAGDDATALACALSLDIDASSEDLAVVLGFPHERVLGAFDRLLGLALVAEADMRFRFSHDLIREVAGSMLNAGRRVLLHRAFARRLVESNERSKLPRAAFHLRAAGLNTHAAATYLESAKDAFEAHAFRSAATHCEGALDALQRGEREENLLRARLHVLRSQALAQIGDMHDALAASEDGVRYARTSRDQNAIVEAILTRVESSNAFLDAGVLRSHQSIPEALDLARASGDERLLVRASVCAASASRMRADEAGALDFAISARNNIERIADASLRFSALDEAVRACTTWWRFADARQLMDAASAAAEQAGSLAQVRASVTRALLYLLMERVSEACTVVAEAREDFDLLARRLDTALPDPSYPLPLIAYGLAYAEAAVARSQGSWDLALSALDRYKRTGAIENATSLAIPITMIEVELRLERGDAGDLHAAAALVEHVPALPALAPAQLFFSSTTPELLHAVVAAHQRRECRASLRVLIDALEERVALQPLDCDRSFSQLALAAERAGLTSLAVRARARSAHHRAARIAAAGIDRR